jgi:hypothetical protein
VVRCQLGAVAPTRGWGAGQQTQAELAQQLLANPRLSPAMRARLAQRAELSPAREVHELDAVISRSDLNPDLTEIYLYVWRDRCQY